MMRSCEASAKLVGVETALAADEHLRALPKERFSQRAFRESLRGPEICRQLRGRGGRAEEPALRRLDAASGCLAPCEVTLTLSRAASGVVYVERAEFHAADNGFDGNARQTMQSLLPGQPITGARQLSLRDLLRCLAPGIEAEAKLPYEALRRTLDRT